MSNQQNIEQAWAIQRSTDERFLVKGFDNTFERHVCFATFFPDSETAQNFIERFDLKDCKPIPVVVRW